MVALEDLWMKPFVDQGQVLDETGRWIRGSDPELHYENGEWFLFHTFGPTKGVKGSPGIYLNRSPDLMTGYSRSKVIIAPDWELDDRGVETFACDYVPPLGKWFAMMTHYKRGKTGSRIVPALADSLGGPWELLHDRAVWPEFEWEQQIGENGVCWSDSFNALACTYGGKSAPPKTQWATGFMASPNFGTNWHKIFQPFAKPPNYFEDGKGINAMAHSTCAEDPSHELVLHCITTYGGHVSADKKGLVQWVFFEGRWHRNPEFLIQAKDMRQSRGVPVAHVGGPSLLYDYGNERWMMAVHVDNKPSGMRRHTRMLFEGAAD